MPIFRTIQAFDLQPSLLGPEAKPMVERQSDLVEFEDVELDLVTTPKCGLAQRFGDQRPTYSFSPELLAYLDVVYLENIGLAQELRLSAKSPLVGNEIPCDATVYFSDYKTELFAINYLVQPIVICALVDHLYKERWLFGGVGAEVRRQQFGDLWYVSFGHLSDDHPMASYNSSVLEWGRPIPSNRYMQPFT